MSSLTSSNTRAAAGPRPGLATALLIAVTVLAFIFQCAADQANLLPVNRTFALSLDGLRRGQLWTLLTFQFLHLRLVDGGALHLLGNLLLIKTFGTAVEQVLGSRKFLGLYLLSGTVGGLLQMALGWVAPAQFGTAVVGASAGACGLLAAYATFFPGRTVHLFFSPVSVRADVLFGLVIVGTVAGLFFPGARIAHGAHLGGMMTGFLMTRTLWRPGVKLATVKCPLNLAVPRS